MSSLKWQPSVRFHPLRAGDRFEVKTQVYELVHDHLGITIFDPFYVPLAEIKKLEHRKWELQMRDGTERTFTTLKAAKAMGIALCRMEE